MMNYERIKELGKWLKEHDRQFDLSGINEQRIKCKIELFKLVGKK